MVCIMGSHFTIQNTHFCNIQVSEFPLIPTSRIFNFISISRISPQFKPSIRFSSSLSISSSSQASISGNSSPELSFEASYLKNTFGFPPELAISKAKYLKFNNSPEKPEKVVEFLKKYGFTETQVSSMVYRLPRLFLSRPETSILPKLQFLTSVGFSRSEITGVLTSVPIIIHRSLENVIVPAYYLLRSLVDSDDKAIALVKRYPKILARSPEAEVGFIQILREVGVPEAHIAYSMCHQSRRGYKNVDNRRIVEKVLEMGFDPTSLKFLRAIRTLRSMSKSAWEHRVEIFKKFGWTDQDILVAFEKNQQFIVSSEDKIVRTMDFLKRMGVETRTAANWPTIFGLSIEKRMVPRSLVYQVIVGKGLCKRKKKLNIVTLACFSENVFLDKVIKPCGNEAPQLLDLYQKMLDT